MATTPGRRTVALGTCAAAVLLLFAAPSPAASVRTIRAAGTAGEPTAPLVALIALLAWLLAAWLLLTIAVTAGGHLPGLPGRVLRSLSRRVAPATVRRGVEVALGLTVVVGLLGGTPAAAAPGPAEGPAAPAGVSLDWAGDTTPALDWGAAAPSAPAPPAPPAEPPTVGPAAPPPAAAGEVVVQPGDSLWALAEQDLTRRGESATDAAVAQAWPTWWAANRDAVGDDPDLIQPGTRLTPPPTDGSAPAGPASS